MGLDIYLYKYDDKELTDKLEKEYEQETEKIWDSYGEYDSMSDEDKEKARIQGNELSEKLGLGKYGCDDKRKHPVELNSKTDPEHYFKIGYFRSSYNGGGINRILNNLNLRTLDELFDVTDEYCFRPDWSAALDKTEKLISELSEAEGLRCFEVSPNIFNPQREITSENIAIEITRSELERYSSFGDGWSNLKGHFYPEGKEIVALMPGTSKILKENPCTYVVYRDDLTWYIDALKIVKDTIEYVMDQDEKEK